MGCMKKINVFKFLGLMGAVFLIAFGGLNNFWRTIKFGILKK
jgi:hypothetical protein